VSLGVPVFFQYFREVFVRQKKNKSGLISVQVIEKRLGKYKVLKTIGSSEDPLAVQALVLQGRDWVLQKKKATVFDFEQNDKAFEQLFAGITAVKSVGASILLGKIFDSIGFNVIEDELFRKLVISRLCYPVSKLRTTEYLRRYEGYITDEDKIYRYLDKLNKTQKRTVQCISYNHTLEVLGGQISMVFYDVTTLYFEASEEDDLRKTGYSKDGKHQNPQIVLGLLVSKGGYPLAYEIFEGGKYEGHTMLPVINLFRRKYKVADLIVVADAGLLSEKNMRVLRENNYSYILGARIKNETDRMKSEIMKLTLANGEIVELNKDAINRLIISYSSARATKDSINRGRGVKKLEKLIAAGKLTKNQVNNKGYNRFLKLEGEVKIKLDEEKIEEDKKWDGLKGYITNCTLTKEEIITNYGYLWQIEKAFRVAKSEIKIRPFYHRLKKRIEAHICIAFVAYKLYKELERILKEKNSGLSPEKVIEIAKTIYQIEAALPNSKQPLSKLLINNEEQRYLANLFNL
jgi:transposase